MTCPVCGGKNHVVDSRPEYDAVHRKRVCTECNHTFYTVEIEAASYEDYRRMHRESKKKGNTK